MFSTIKFDTDYSELKADDKAFVDGFAYCVSRLEDAGYQAWEFLPELDEDSVLIKALQEAIDMYKTHLIEFLQSDLGELIQSTLDQYPIVEGDE